MKLSGSDYNEQASSRTIGWSPACNCNDGDPMSCNVLDPFNGSGTTGAVAVLHGRNYIGIELNEEYRQMARRRIGAVAPLLSVESP